METGSTTPDHPPSADGIASVGRQSPAVPFESRFYCSLGFLVAAMAVGTVAAFVDVYVLRHVEPKFTRAPIYAFQISMYAFVFAGGLASILFSLTVLALGSWRGRYRFSPLRRTLLACAAGTAFVCMFGAMAALDLRLPDGLGLFLCLLLLPVLLGLIYVLLTQDRRLSDQPQCPKCGYLLYHAVENRCPECGRSFSVTEIDTRHAVVDADGVLRPKPEMPAEQHEEPA